MCYLELNVNDTGSHKHRHYSSQKLQFTNSDIRPIWAVSLVIKDGHSQLPTRVNVGLYWVHIYHPVGHIL